MRGIVVLGHRIVPTYLLSAADAESIREGICAGMQINGDVSDRRTAGIARITVGL